MIIKIDERIRELREASGITQTQLAKKMGVTRSSVNTWEMGIAIPSTTKLIELAMFFHVSTDYLLGLEDSRHINISNLTEDETQVVYSLLTLFDRQKETE